MESSTFTGGKIKDGVYVRTYLILMDAFRHDYLKEEVTPFLCSCAQQGEYYQRVVQSLGFCERAEILSGLKPDSTGFFTAIGYDPQNSPYRSIRGLRILDVVEKIGLIGLRCLGSYFASKCYRRLRGYANRYFWRKGISMSTFMIPPAFLKYFSLTEDGVDIRKPEAFPEPSIFTLLEKAGKDYFYDSFTALNIRTSFSDQGRLNRVCQVVKEIESDLFLIYISIPDAVGHRFGPDSNELKESLRNMDQMLKNFVNEVEKQTSGNRYIFLGDHGMLAVKATINIEAELLACLGSKGLKPKVDFLYFLDSTMLRVWFLKENVQWPINELLMTSKLLKSNGIFINGSEAKRFHIPWKDRRYGDLLWLANPGVQIFPDFFHRVYPSKGMHGYDPEIPESQGMCIYYGSGILPNVIPSIHLTDIYDILKRSLGL